MDGLEQKAKASGASQLVVKDLKEEFVREYIFPCLRAGAVYERKYLLGTSMARPVIAKVVLRQRHIVLSSNNIIFAFHASILFNHLLDLHHFPPQILDFPFFVPHVMFCLMVAKCCLISRLVMFGMKILESKCLELFVIKICSTRMIFIYSSLNFFLSLC